MFCVSNEVNDEVVGAHEPGIGIHGPLGMNFAVGTPAVTDQGTGCLATAGVGGGIGLLEVVLMA